MRADDAIVADRGPVQDGRADADQAIIADDAAVQHRPVPDRAAAPDLERNALVGVENAMFLDVRALADFEEFVIPAQHRPEPDRHVAPERDLADDIGAWRDPVGADGRKVRRHPIERQNAGIERPVSL